MQWRLLRAEPCEKRFRVVGDHSIDMSIGHLLPVLGFVDGVRNYLDAVTYGTYAASAIPLFFAASGTPRYSLRGT